MAGQRQRWTPLQLLLISSLLILTNQIEVTGGVEERLSHDTAAGRLFQGTPELQLFINPEIYRKVDQNKVKELTEDFRILESLTWGMFHPEAGEPQKVSIHNLQNFVIGDNTTKEIQGKTPEEKIRHVLERCYAIGGGGDIRRIIRHYAENGKNETTFLMVSNWIFRVDPESLYVTPAGKLLTHPEQREDVVKLINDQNNREHSESYSYIRGRIKDKERKGYGHYVKNIFLPLGAAPQSCETELFFSTWYFTASNIMESVRNYRTFILVLMALDMDERFIDRRPDFWFNQHSMARGGSWTDKPKRGFRGSAAPSIDQMTPDQINKVVELLRLEHVVLEKWLASVEGNKLKAIAGIAVKSGVLEQSQENEFRKDSCDFMTKAMPLGDGMLCKEASGVSGAESSGETSGSEIGQKTSSNSQGNTLSDVLYWLLAKLF